MSRVKIQLPAKSVFETQLKIRITDLNYGKHLGNDSTLSLLHEARVQFLNAFGYPNEIDIEGLGIIMADVAIQFKGEGHYGDTWSISIYVDNINRMGFDLYYRAINQDGKETLRAKTGLLMFDYDQKKIALLPDSLREKWG